MAQKRFDYFAARQSGASDDDIAAYLAQRQAAGDSLYVDRKEVDRWNKSQQQASAEPQLSPWRQTAKSYLDKAPVFFGGLGGAGGATLGGGLGAATGAVDFGATSVPGALIGGTTGGIMGAQLGGATGAGIRDLGYAALGIPQQPGGVPLHLAQGAHEQALAEMGGRAAGIPIEAAAKAVIPGLVRASIPALERVSQKYPNIDWLNEFLAANRPIKGGFPGDPARTSSRFLEDVKAKSREADQLAVANDAARRPVSVQVPQTQPIFMPKVTSTATTTPTPAFLGGARAETANLSSELLVQRTAAQHGMSPKVLSKLASSDIPISGDVVDAMDRGISLDQLRSLRAATGKLSQQAAEAVVPGEASVVARRLGFEPGLAVTGQTAERTTMVPKKRYTADDLLTGVYALRDKLQHSAERGSDTAALDKLIDNFKRDHPGLLKEQDLLRIRRMAGSAGKTARAAIQGSGSVASAAASPMSGSFNAAINAGAIANASPEVNMAMRSSRTAKALATATRLSENMRAGTSFAPGGSLQPASLASKASYYLGNNPYMASRAALFLNNPANRDALARSPVMAARLAQMLYAGTNQ